MPRLTEGAEIRRDAAIDYIKRFAGIPYRWGGSSPEAGFDCSGLAMEYLISAGLVDPSIDMTAHDIYITYKDYPQDIADPGCLKFWLNAGRASHIEIFINPYQVIGASGGGSPKFNLFDEIKKDPILRNFYGHLTAEEFRRRENDLFVRIAKELLFTRQAVDQNAYIKVRPEDYRKGQTKIVNPFLKD